MNNFGLYLILTEPYLSYTTITKIAVEENIKMLQLRTKKETDRETIKIAKKMKKITDNTSTNLIINDRVDIAMIVNSDGVHLGQTDISLLEAKKIWNKDKIFGKSTHNLKQARESLKENPDYIGFGPIWPTDSKKIPDPVLGLESLNNFMKVDIDIPIVGIGGIKDYNLNKVLEKGINSFGMISYITDSRSKFEIRRRIKKIKKIYKEGRG